MFDVTSESEARVFACPVCVSSRLKQLAAVPGRWIGSWLFEPYRGKLGLSRCADCDLVFVNPRPNSRLLSAFYKSERYVCHKLDDPESMLAKADHVLGRLEHHQPGRGVLLDFGCGSGWLIERARQRGWDAVGFDVGDSALAHCRERGLPVVDSPAQIADASCDAIVLHHVLEHVERFDELFEVLGRMLKPGGKLFVEVPNADSLRARLSPPALCRYLAADERYRAFPIHLSYFSGASLSRLMERFGFAARGIETYGIGLDEYFYNPDSEHTAYAGLRTKTRSPWLRPLRQLIKRGLYGLNLGENLLVVAERPRAEAAPKQSVAESAAA